MKLIQPQSSYAAKKDGLWERLCEEVDALTSLAEADDWWRDFQILRLRHLPPVFQGPLRDRLNDRRAELTAAAMSRSLDLQFARAMERDR